LGKDTLTFAKLFPLAYRLRKVFYLEYLLLPFGMVVFWKNFPKLRFLIYSSLLLPIAFFFLHFEPFIHYFLPLTPLLFLFLASGLSFLLQQKNRFLKISGWLIFPALITTSIVFNTAFFQLLAKQKHLKGDYGSIFTTTEQSTKKHLEKYQNDPHYQEMILASYLPKNLLYGSLPVAKMIYSYSETKKHLASLEKRIKQVPEDARVQNELIAFYTTTPPTKATVNFLKKKSQLLPGYQPVYNEVQKLFLEQNH